jgi:hypothetical protein
MSEAQAVDYFGVIVLDSQVYDFKGLSINFKG